MGEKYEDKGEKPEKGDYLGFDHVTFFVGNALQAADWYCLRFGFRKIAYKGLETGCRDRVHHVIKLNDIIYEFISSLYPGDKVLGQMLEKHGDGAQTIAFAVDDARGIYEEAVKRGATSTQAVQELSDEHGKVTISGVKTYGDTCHLFVERKNYKGIFLPGYKDVSDQDDPIYHLLGKDTTIDLKYIDHIVGNTNLGDMNNIVEWYTNVLQWHRFWSIDDKTMRTEYSALNSVVVASYSEKVKMPINEPAPGKKKSQIQEYVEHYGGPGVQHIAMRTEDIITTVTRMRARGTKFLEVP
eukprot:TRINITY_DN6086_c0_g1_i1.p1 TRINITY_DN6086_c0_g1~~TRINITY_DN6086_c0_g1_i1.p1  ORF type:complete len:298 (+),score=81.16 TRINITY_DN6086_c0_g1_i1:45-938(+)